MQCLSGTAMQRQQVVRHPVARWRCLLLDERRRRLSLCVVSLSSTTPLALSLSIPRVDTTRALAHPRPIPDPFLVL